MNRALRGLRGFVAAGVIAAVAQGFGSVALSPAADAASATLTATTAVNVRSAPSTDASRLGVLYQGDKVEAVSSSNGWTEVRWNGRVGYVASAYLTGGSVSAPPSSSTPPSASQGTVYTTANLNLRTGPSLSGSVYTVAPKGTKLELTGEISGSYAQVIYQSRTLWAATSYLSASAGSTSDSLPAVTGTKRATTALMIRTTPDSDFKSLGDVPKGTILSVTGVVTNGMAQVIWQGSVRWVNNKYLAEVTDETAPGQPSTPATTVQYATTALNIWAASTGSSYSGEIPRGGQVNITGKVENGRAEIVLNGAIKWVTAKYLSSTPPSTDSGSTSGDINKGYSSGLDKTNADIQRVTWYIWNNYPQIKTMYGWRKDTTPDHPAGRAVDVMIPSYKTNTDLGWSIVNYFKKNAKAYNISYIIYQQKIWSVARSSEGWRAMADRGGDTANHYDHIHINSN